MSFKNIIKIYLKYVLKFKIRYFVFLFGVISAAVSGNLLPLFYKFFVEALQEGNADKLYKPLVFIVVLLVIHSLCSQILYHAQNTLYFKAIQSLKTDAVINLQNQDYEYHTSKSTGKLIATLSRCDNAFFTLLEKLNNKVFSSFLYFIIPIFIISTISKKVAFSIALILIISIPIIFLLLKLNLKLRKKTYEPEGLLTSVIVDNLSNFETVKAFSKERKERERLKNRYDSYTHSMYNYSYTFRIMDMVLFLIYLSIIIAGILLGIDEFRDNKIDLANFVVIVGFLFQYPGRLFEFFYDLREIVKSTTDFNSFAELLNLKPTVIDKSNLKNIKKPAGELQFKNVSFGYGESEILSDLSLKINANENIALVGPSGAGKSTVIKLILRYYDVKSGSICIDNININDLSQEELRNLIGIVPQDPLMFDNTIFFNVGYALDNPTIEDVKKACKLAQIHDFIETLPEKYETIVGERGIKLSGGQRQRLAIARMILKDPAIIIFDEATSALDSESEQLIHKAFIELARNKTTIIIAHRLSTITHCDNIFVLDNGTLSQEGKHTELIKNEGIYKKLWDIQSEGFKI